MDGGDRVGEGGECRGLKQDSGAGLNGHKQDPIQYLAGLELSR